MRLFSDTMSVYALIDLSSGKVVGWQAAPKDQQPLAAKTHAVYSLRPLTA